MTNHNQENDTTMPAYIIVEIDVTDPEGYEEYKRLAAPTVHANGGKYIVRGGRTETLEGNWSPKRIVVLEFPSVDQAKQWWNAAEYADVKAIRHRCASSRMIVAEGC